MSSSASGFRNKYFYQYVKIFLNSISIFLDTEKLCLLFFINSPNNYRTVVLSVLVSVSHLLTNQLLLLCTSTQKMKSITGSISPSKLARICDTRRSPQPSRGALPQNTLGSTMTIFVKIGHLSHHFKPQNYQTLPTGRNSVGERPEAEPIAGRSKKSSWRSNIHIYIYINFPNEKIENVNVNQTRPSALGMSDPIWGSLIHIFVDEKKKCEG